MRCWARCRLARFTPPPVRWQQGSRRSSRGRGRCTRWSCGWRRPTRPACCMWRRTHSQVRFACCMASGAGVGSQLPRGVRLPPHPACMLVFAHPAAAGALGQPTAASNTLQLVWDTQPPQVRTAGGLDCGAVVLHATLVVSPLACGDARLTPALPCLPLQLHAAAVHRPPGQVPDHQRARRPAAHQLWGARDSAEPAKPVWRRGLGQVGAAGWMPEAGGAR